MTGYRGSPWTIQSGWVQSANYADSGNSFLEATGVSTDGLEFEFTGQMIGQGTQDKPPSVFDGLRLPSPGLG